METVNIQDEFEGIIAREFAPATEVHEAPRLTSELATGVVELQEPFGVFTTGLRTLVDATRAATMTSTGYTGNNYEESC